MKSNRLIPFQTWRLTFFQAVIFAVFLIFGIRMYELQVIRHEEFELVADENRFSLLPSRRGAARSLTVTTGGSPSTCPPIT